MRRLACIAFGFGLLGCSTAPEPAAAPLPPAAIAAPELDGLWVLQIRRQSWKPRDLEFVLEVDAEHGGVGTVDPVFIGRTTAALTAYSADADAIRFTLHSAIDDIAYRFEAHRDGGSLVGVVHWNDGTNEQTEPFAGYRREVRRFDVDVARFPTELDPRAVGVEPVLLDRLVLGAETARSDGLFVISDGRLIAARTFGGPDDKDRVGSLTADLAGLAHGDKDFVDGVRLRPSDLAALGQAMLDGGVWTGDRAVPEAWMQLLVAPTATSAGPWSIRADPLDKTRAALGFGHSTDAGEGLLVYPPAHLVVVRTLRRAQNAYDARYDSRDRMEWLGSMSDAIAMDKLDLQPVPR
jgi:hypothetical protein